ncbi:DUF3095 domain-containing protein [Tropicibacter sp. Alg240-R139]|uniref:DUF3095 domain-containing protein n=1 Tax=Tropicibacter sp. Alg240-R139 TaxID=2305991 RepID=UPI0013DE995F|nr:DUF3095 domain-containing protein [Tropicibacter sp. Alg240-R139]
MGTDKEFYDTLTITASFDVLTEPSQYTPVPGDWFVGTADIVNSTGEIANGRYKTVNMVGAAVISAIANAIGSNGFPYVFGGDGASFALHGSHRATAEQTLANLRRWASEKCNVELRAAIVPVSEIRKAGIDVRIARFAASSGADYAMFSGGGLAWAEKQMKAGYMTVGLSEPGAEPDLTGLSCRWTNVQAEQGEILSLVVLPSSGASERDFADITQRVVQAIGGLDRAGHPVPVEGPRVGWSTPGLNLEALSLRGRIPVWMFKSILFLKTLFSWTLFKTNLNVGSFDPAHYKRMLSANADYRKFDDGLKMTLDCDPSTRTRIEAILSDAKAREKVRYGLFAQSEAMVTCFVPSAMQDDHVHFIDGAAGGYAQASAQLKPDIKA